MLGQLDQLHRLVTVADTGSLFAAAQTLGLSQPALTRALRRLEAAAGGPLFERHARGLTPTALGERALGHARRILRDGQLAEADLAALRGGETGQLRIAAAPVWMTAILPDVVARLHETYPAVEIRLHAMTLHEDLVRLREGAIDVVCGGFQDIGPLPSFLVRRPMFDVTLDVVGRTGHPVFGPAAPSASDLLACSWVSYGNDRAFLHPVMDRIAPEAAARPLPVVRCDSLSAVMALVSNGDYLSCLPVSFLDVARGYDLRALGRPAFQARFTSGVIYRRSLEEFDLFARLRDLTAARIGALGLDRARPDKRRHRDR